MHLNKGPRLLILDNFSFWVETLIDPKIIPARKKAH